MIAETKKAAARTTARKNTQQHESYSTVGCMSSATLQGQLGTTLLTLQRLSNRDQQRKCLKTFEAMLRHYVDLKLCEVLR